MTDAMKQRTERTGAIWKDEGDGYFSAIAFGPMCRLAYIALPTGHPAIGQDLDGEAPVNGGITFQNDNVFGWDYGHYENYSTPDEDIPTALEFFRAYANITSHGY